ncbi:MAG: phosphotransferase [Candidatus Obscuribacter sp.]|nr:phosphotransferase [Candidatus Obscuribacter sp.]
MTMPAENQHNPTESKSGLSKSSTQDDREVPNPTLDLLKPVPEEKLQAWLLEFYGKEMELTHRQVLRHRDLSYVERLQFRDALPASLIFKQVLPPWDIEQDLHERILIPSISNSPQLFMSAHLGQITAMLMEDLGPDNLLGCLESQDETRIKGVAHALGEELAKMHRSYSYRTDELLPLGILRSLSPIDYATTAEAMVEKLTRWQLADRENRLNLVRLAETIAGPLAGEPISLSHGDLYAENIVLRQNKLFIIDWSWFAMLGVPLVDIATITMEHPKNSSFTRHKEALIDAYCFESGKPEKDVRQALPHAEALSRLLFLDWLLERKTRGIEGTTVGPVNDLIERVVQELSERLRSLSSRS